MGNADRGNGRAKKEQRAWKRTRAEREWSTVYWVLGGFTVMVSIISGFSAYSSGSAADIVQLSVNDSEMLKEVFYGGKPWLVVCSDESASAISKFVSLNAAATQIAEDGMKTAVLDCTDTFPKKGDNALKRFKLNQKKSGKFPITFFVVNGNKPKQLGKYVLTDTTKIVGFCNKYGSTSQLQKEKTYKFKGQTASDPQNLLFERCFKKKNKGCTLLARNGPLSVREAVTIQEKVQAVDRKSNFVLVDKRKYQFDQFELFAPTNDTQLFHFRQLPKQKKAKGSKRFKYKGTEYSIGGRLHKQPLADFDAKAWLSMVADESGFKKLSALPELSLRDKKASKKGKGKTVHLSSTNKKGSSGADAKDAKDAKAKQAVHERRAREKMDEEAKANIPEAIEDEEDEEGQEQEEDEEDADAEESADEDEDRDGDGDDEVDEVIELDDEEEEEEE